MKVKISVYFKAGGEAAKRLTPAIKRSVLAAASKIPGEINVVILGDAEITKLNKQFLNHKGTTDVITFSYPRPAFSTQTLMSPHGEIYICLPQAKRQAKIAGHSLETELLILATHGALHLTGMDDSTPALRKKMNIKTVKLLNNLLEKEPYEKKISHCTNVPFILRTSSRRNR